MPYFLVTHTALVEADDEAAAAAKVYDAICDSENLTFDVKADEHTATRIIIPTRAKTESKSFEPRGAALPAREAEQPVILSHAENADAASAVDARSDGVFRSSGLLLLASVGAVTLFYVFSRLFT